MKIAFESIFFALILSYFLKEAWVCTLAKHVAKKKKVTMKNSDE